MNETHLETEPQRSWYVVATRPNQESMALGNLTRQGYRVFLPEIRLKKRRQNRWVTVVEPLFPGYLFVQIAFGEDDPTPIRSTRGCCDLVRFGEYYPPIPASVLEELTSQAASERDAEPLFIAGDNVQVETGPFAGVIGVFDMPKGHDRAQVLIEILGKVQKVMIDSDQLLKTSD